LPLEVAPVVLGSNYESHNDSAYKFNNSATAADPQYTRALNFSEREQSTADLI